MKRILVLTFSTLPKDPRILRHLTALGEKYHLIAAAHQASQTKHAGINETIDLKRPPKSGLLEMVARKLYMECKLHERYYWLAPRVRHAWESIKNVKCDLILANDLNTLPLAMRLKDTTGAKLLFDAHEYYTGQYTDAIFHKFYKPHYDFLLTKYMHRADLCMTVGHAIAQKYAENYNAPCEVLTNATQAYAAEPSPVGNTIRMVHHGNATRLRETEVMVEVMRHLPKHFSLDLILVNKEPDYHAHIQQLAAGIPSVNILPPVPYEHILPTLNEYDLGFYMLPQTCFNMEYALPNKLYEFVQARLGIAIWPSPEMARIVKEHDLGVVSEADTIDSMAAALADVSKEDVIRWKNNAHGAAEKLNSEVNAEHLRSLTGRVLAS